MIVRIKGRLSEKRDQSVILDVNGIFYEITVSASVLNRIEEAREEDGEIKLVTYHYWQIGPSSGVPIMIGFINEIESDFFQQFIKVSGIGPRAAVRALSQPISDITRAIDAGDTKYLTTLPGIGLQRAKEIVAKLQGKIGKFGLIQDGPSQPVDEMPTADWHEEALAVLLQLQYKKKEAEDMIATALKKREDINNTEELLNEIYKQKVI